MYVRLTSKLLLVQQGQVRTSAQESALRELTVLITRSLPTLPDESDLPFNLEGEPNSKIKKMSGKLEELGNELVARSALLPIALYRQAIPVVNKLYIGSLSLILLNNVCLREEIEIAGSDEPWSVENLRVRWYRDDRDQSQSKFEWGELTDGSLIIAANQAVRTFENVLVAALQSQQPPQ